MKTAITSMSKKKIFGFTLIALLIEFLVAWAGFVYLPIVGLIFVLAGWATIIYCCVLIFNKAKRK